MNIHQNLKACRARLGMTQEQAAEQLHTTRQTVSNYETGRTQPDLDTLGRLAELYRVPVETLLYGDRDEQKALRLRRAAWIVLACYLAGLLLCAAFQFGIDRAIPPDSLSAYNEVVQLRFRLVRGCEGASLAVYLLFRLALLALLIADQTRKAPGSLRIKLLLLAVLAGGALAVTAPWSWFDGFHGFGDYTYMAISGIVRGVFVLAADLIVWAIRRKAGQARGAQSGT